VAPDTGSDIIGAARADLDWGAGGEAGKVAGRIGNQGRFVMLLPRALDMVEAGHKMPLPQPKPPIPTEVASKGDKSDGKADRSKNAKSDNAKSDNGKSGDKNAKARPQAGKPKPGT